VDDTRGTGVRARAVRGTSPRLRAGHTSVSTFLLVAVALSGLASNSLLTRLALVPGHIDAAGFSVLRLGGGAVGLALVVMLHDRWRRATGATSGPGPDSIWRWRGDWLAPSALAAYTIPFTYAFGRVEAGVGVLVVFGAVQFTMVGVGLWQGERPTVTAWLGLGVALLGLAGLTLPGAGRPDPIGLLLSAVAGVAWGAYTLLGRGSSEPLRGTARNFVLATPMVVALLAPILLRAAPATPAGYVYGLSSGVVSSGLAYVVWYAVLPRLTALRAALIQLLVPVMVAIAAIPVLGEALSVRAVVMGAAVIAGVALALVGRRGPAVAARSGIAPRV